MALEVVRNYQLIGSASKLVEKQLKHHKDILKRLLSIYNHDTIGRFYKCPFSLISSGITKFSVQVVNKRSKNRFSQKGRIDKALLYFLLFRLVFCFELLKSLPPCNLH